MKNNFNEEDIRKFYRLLAHEKGTEIRVFPQGIPVSHFVHSEDIFIEKCKKHNGKCNVYAGMNERCAGGKKDKDVCKLKLVYFDIDLQRKKDTSATEEEKRRALSVSRRRRLSNFSRGLTKQKEGGKKVERGCSICALAHYHDALPVKAPKKKEKRKNAILTTACSVCNDGFWHSKDTKIDRYLLNKLRKNSKGSSAVTRSARVGVSRRGFSLTRIVSTNSKVTGRSGALGGGAVRAESPASMIRVGGCHG